MPVSWLASPLRISRSAAISLARCLRISQRNRRRQPAGPGHLDLAYANRMISVWVASIGVKYTYTRQRTMASRAVTGSPHQWSITMYTGEKYVVQLALNQYPLRTPIMKARRGPSGL